MWAGREGGEEISGEGLEGCDGRCVSGRRRTVELPRGFVVVDGDSPHHACDRQVPRASGARGVAAGALRPRIVQDRAVLRKGAIENLNPNDACGKRGTRGFFIESGLGGEKCGGAAGRAGAI